MRRTVLASLAVILLLAGCSGVDTASTPGFTPGASAEVAEFTELNDAERQAFLQSIESEVSFVPESPFVDDGFDYNVSTVFEDHDYVNYDGGYYSTTIEQGETIYSSYGLEARETEREENDTVVTLADLPTDVRSEVHEAITNGSTEVPAGKWSGALTSLLDADVVKSEGQHYSIGVAVGDYWAEVMTAEKQSNQS